MIIYFCSFNSLWKNPFMERFIYNKRIIWENKWILDLSIKVGTLFGPDDFLISTEDISLEIEAGVVTVRNIGFITCFLNKEVKRFLEGCIFWASFVPILVKNKLNAVATCTGSDIDLFFPYW